MAEPLFSPEALQRAIANLPPESTPGPASSSEGVGLGPYLAAMAGQGADLASTLRNFHNGYGESNALMGSGQPVGRIIATKAAFGLGGPLLMHWLANHGDSPEARQANARAAKLLGYAIGAAGGIPAAINLAQPNLK